MQTHGGGEGISIVGETIARLAELPLRLGQEGGDAGAVAVLTAGPGVTNGISAMTSAHMTGSPLVVLGGMADTLRRGGRDVGVPASWLVAAVLGMLVLLLGLGLTAARAVDELDLVFVQTGLLGELSPRCLTRRLTDLETTLRHAAWAFSTMSWK